MVESQRSVNDVVIDNLMMSSSNAEYDDTDTASNCSYEETAAKIELALRRSLRLDMVDSAIDGFPMNSGSISPSSHRLCIDVRKLEGYQEIPVNCPSWKRTMLEKKNKQLEDYAMKEILAKRQEEDRWRNVPEWKKALILEKEKKKDEMQLSVKLHEREVKCLDSLPEWKRNLVMKKRMD